MAVASSGRPAEPRGRLTRIVRFVAKASLERSANLLTTFRLVAALPVAWLIVIGDDGLALGLFIVAALSDAVDGFLAKRLNTCSTFGAALDPIADKLLVCASLLALASRDLLPLWLVALVLARDVSILGVSIFLRLRLHRFAFHPLIIGKLCTFMLLVTVIGVLGAEVGLLPFANPIPGWHSFLALIVVASSLAYIAAAWQLVQAERNGPTHASASRADPDNVGPNSGGE